MWLICNIYYLFRSEYIWFYLVRKKNTKYDNINQNTKYINTRNINNLVYLPIVNNI